MLRAYGRYRGVEEIVAQEILPLKGRYKSIYKALQAYSSVLLYMLRVCRAAWRQCLNQSAAAATLRVCAGSVVCGRKLCVRRGMRAKNRSSTPCRWCT